MKQHYYVTPHAQRRFLERVLAPHGLICDDRFQPRYKIPAFIRSLVRQPAGNSQMTDLEDVVRVWVPWPFKNDCVPGVILVLDLGTGEVLTCWANRSLPPRPKDGGWT